MSLEFLDTVNLDNVNLSYMPEILNHPIVWKTLDKNKIPEIPKRITLWIEFKEIDARKLFDEILFKLSKFKDIEITIRKPSLFTEEWSDEKIPLKYYNCQTQTFHTGYYRVVKSSAVYKENFRDAAILVKCSSEFLGQKYLEKLFPSWFRHLDYTEGDLKLMRKYIENFEKIPSEKLYEIFKILEMKDKGTLLEIPLDILKMMKVDFI